MGTSVCISGRVALIASSDLPHRGEGEELSLSLLRPSTLDPPMNRGETNPLSLQRQPARIDDGRVETGANSLVRAVRRSTARATRALSYRLAQRGAATIPFAPRRHDRSYID